MNVYKIIFVLFLYGCSQVSVKKQPPTDDVSVAAALDHIFASYLRGCVDAFSELKVPISFEICRDKAKLHRIEIQEMIDQVPK